MIDLPLALQIPLIVFASGCSFLALRLFGVRLPEPRDESERMLRWINVFSPDIDLSLRRKYLAIRIFVFLAAYFGGLGLLVVAGSLLHAR